jgi:hypothetical protein
VPCPGRVKTINRLFKSGGPFAFPNARDLIPLSGHLEKNIVGYSFPQEEQKVKYAAITV